MGNNQIHLEISYIRLAFIVFETKNDYLYALLYVFPMHFWR